MTTSTESQKRKRRRLIIACLECHRRRVKCDRGEPCKACIRHGVADTCTYEGLNNDNEPNVSGPSTSKIDNINPIRAEKAPMPDFYDLSNLDSIPNFSTSSLSFPTLPKQKQNQNQSTSGSMNSGSSPNKLSAFKTSTVNSISPTNLVEDPSPASSSCSQQRSEAAPLAKFLRQSQGENILPIQETIIASNPISSPTENPAKRTKKVASEYTREDAARIRKACSDWPPVSRIPNMIKFYFTDLKFFHNILEDTEVNSFVSRRILPLLESKSDDEFYNRIRPGDATKLAVMSTIIINSCLRCSVGLLSLWSVPRQPKERIPSDAFTAESRNKVAFRIKESIKKLLMESINLDEPSYDQVRALIGYMETLKSEGTLAGTEAQIWLPRLTMAAEDMGLLEDLPREIDQEDREKHRRLFVDFVACNWFGATMYGEHLRVPGSRLLTKFPEIFQDRAQEIKMMRFKLGSTFADISAINHDGKMNWRKVDDIEEELQEQFRALPEDVRPETAQSQFKSYKTSLFINNGNEEGEDIRLQKHLLGVLFNYLRGIAHRTRFFPHPDIPQERVQHSRNICIETAQDIIWLQQESRADTCSDSWLRGFHFVYLTLEHAIVIVLAALTTLGDAETEQQNKIDSSSSVNTNWEGGPLQEAVKKARSLLDWGQRAADLLAGLPMDVSTNIQANEFLQRLVSKAENLIDWYESYARTSQGPRVAIFSAVAATKHLLSDNDGRPVHIPLLDDSVGVNKKVDSHQNQHQQEVRNIEDSSASLFLSGIPIENSSISNNTDSNQMFNIDPSAIADLNYLGGLDNASFSLPRKDEEDPLSMFQSVPPLEEQIDVWLSLLQQ